MPLSACHCHVMFWVSCLAMWWDIFLFSGGNSLKLAENIRHMSEISQKRCQRSRLLWLHLWELCECDTCLVIRGILMKLATDIHYASRKNWNDCQGQRSKVNIASHNLMNAISSHLWISTKLLFQLCICANVWLLYGESINLDDVVSNFIGLLFTLFVNFSLSLCGTGKLSWLRFSVWAWFDS